MKTFVNTIAVVSYVLFGLILTSIVPGAMSAAEALAVRGASGGAGCGVSGFCPSCTAHTCATVRVGINTTTCIPPLPANFGTDGCTLAAGFMTKCVPIPAGAGCTVTVAPGVGSCGSLVAPMACPAQPAVAPAMGTICDTAIAPTCGPSAAAPAICDLCR